LARRLEGRAVNDKLIAVIIAVLAPWYYWKLTSGGWRPGFTSEKAFKEKAMLFSATCCQLLLPVLLPLSIRGYRKTESDT